MVFVALGCVLLLFVLSAIFGWWLAYYLDRELAWRMVEMNVDYQRCVASRLALQTDIAVLEDQPHA
jgi:hypothetical protein